MSKPLNGAEFGSGRRAAGSEAAEITPRVEEKDQFEQEGIDEVVEEGEEGAKEPAPTVTVLPPKRVSSPHEHRGDPERLKDISSIMADLLGANLTDLRITNIALDLNGTHKLKITFGNSGRPEKRGRVLTLYTQDGTWAYEA